MPENETDTHTPDASLCKLYCESVTETTVNRRVFLRAEYDPSLLEDARLSLNTPDAKMELSINNPNLVHFFKPGKKYYIEIWPQEKYDPENGQPRGE